MSMWDGMFAAWREKPAATRYSSLRTAVTEDYTFCACITLVLILAVSYLLTLAGLPKNEKLKSLAKYLIGTGVMGSMLFCLYGQEWHSGTLYSRMEYSGKISDINATLGISVGLKQINVTLKGEPEKQDNEQIDYSEKFKMETYKSLGGSYEYLLKRGAPYPILWVGEYLAMDAGGIRHGRYYRIAGHYAYISLWAAFTTWIVTCIAYNINLRPAAYCTVLTGALVLTGVFSYTAISPNTLRIPFRDGWLIVKKGWCFWLAMVLGVLTALVGLGLILLDHFLPTSTAAFFSVKMTKSQPHRTNSSLSNEPTMIQQTIIPMSSAVNSNTTQAEIVAMDQNCDLRKRSVSVTNPTAESISQVVADMGTNEDLKMEQLNNTIHEEDNIIGIKDDLVKEIDSNPTDGTTAEANSSEL